MIFEHTVIFFLKNERQSVFVMFSMVGKKWRRETRQQMFQCKRSLIQSGLAAHPHWLTPAFCRRASEPASHSNTRPVTKYMTSEDMASCWISGCCCCSDRTRAPSSCWKQPACPGAPLHNPLRGALDHPSDLSHECTQSATHPRATADRGQTGGIRWDYCPHCSLLFWRLSLPSSPTTPPWFPL